MTEKDVDRCISSGVSEEVCNELRNWWCYETIEY
jgi:hypothetical protein